MRPFLNGPSKGWSLNNPWFSWYIQAFPACRCWGQREGKFPENGFRIAIPFSENHDRASYNYAFSRRRCLCTPHISSLL